MEKQHKALKLQEGVKHPPNINPEVLKGRGTLKRKKYSSEEFISGIKAGDRTVLSRAITLTESSLQEHQDIIQELIEKCLPYSGNSVRVGITGVPGVGKSTFIETFGLYLTGEGRRVAVLAIDPSSNKTRGSILGDKTRMQKLSVDKNAYVRPSPASGTLGGVARKTREAIILCEAAGFNTILVETVGVGQSEFAVHSMVDFFLLLMLTGGGDELQGIKRGIMEMADAIAITKADGLNRIAAENTRTLFQNAITFYPSGKSGWEPRVMVCSAHENKGITELWEQINKYVVFTKANGYFDEHRKEQAVSRMNDTIMEHLINTFHNDETIKKAKPHLENMLKKGKMTSYRAAVYLIDKYFKKV